MKNTISELRHLCEAIRRERPDLRKDNLWKLHLYNAQGLYNVHTLAPLLCVRTVFRGCAM